jgi:hypothetical protein
MRLQFPQTAKRPLLESARLHPRRLSERKRGIQPHLLNRRPTYLRRLLRLSRRQPLQPHHLSQQSQIHPHLPPALLQPTPLFQ